MFKRLTNTARTVMALANQEAQRLSHEYIGTEHILLGLLKDGSGTGAMVLTSRHVDLRKVHLEVEKLIRTVPDLSSVTKLPQTPPAKKVIEYAIEEAHNLDHHYVGSEHLLLGLLRGHDDTASEVLRKLGLELDVARSEVRRLLAATGGRAPNPRPARDADLAAVVAAWPRLPAPVRAGIRAMVDTVS